MPRNISYAENALRLRQAILDGLQQVNTIKELSKLMFAENPLMKASINNVNYHIQYLIDEGYVKQTGQITINSSRAFTYRAIISQYKLPVTFCKNSDYVEKPAPQATIKGAVKYSLDDKNSSYRANYAATQRKRDEDRKSGKVYIGSTFNMI